MERSRVVFSDRLARWLFLALAVAIYLFLVVPSLLVVPMSFGGTDVLAFPPSSYSLDLYRRFFASPVWTESAVRSVLVASITAILSTVIGSCAAYGLNRGSFAGQRIVGMILLSPILLPTIVIALGVYFYFSFLGITGTGLGLVAAHSVLTIPYVIVTVSSGLRQIDPNIELAASMMGASPPSVFLRVVVPQLVPSLVSAALFAFLISFDEVVIAWFISGADSATLPVVMFSSLKLEVSPVIAAAASMLSVASVLICIVSGLLQKSQGGRES